MGHKWIVAVLADLRTYAELNDLARLAASLEGMARLAEDEIAAAEAGAPIRARDQGAPIRACDQGALIRARGDGSRARLGAAGGGAGPR